MSDLIAPLSGLIVFVALTGLCVAAAYAMTTYNDLSRRLERLKALQADVRRISRRGHAVRGAVARHVGTATRHERRTIGNAAKRGGRGGRLVSIQDNANGWPQATAVGTTERGLAADIETRDREQQGWLQLHAEAQQYNARLRTFPSSVVGHAFGFRPWRLKGQRRWNGQRWGHPKKRSAS